VHLVGFIIRIDHNHTYYRIPNLADFKWTEFLFSLITATNANSTHTHTHTRARARARARKVGYISALYHAEIWA